MNAVIVLPEGFAQKRQEAQEAYERSTAGCRRLQNELAALQKAIAATRPLTPLIDRQEEISDLFQRYGSYQKAQQDLPRRRADYKRLQEEAADILKKLGKAITLDSAENLRLPDPAVTRITELGREHRSLMERQRAFSKRLSEIEAELKKNKSQLAELPHVGRMEPLNAVLAAVAKWGDISETLRNGTADVEKRQKAVERDLKRLGLWKASLASLEAHAFPSAATVEAYQENFSDLDSRRRQLDQSIDEANQQTTAMRLQIDALKAGEKVPTDDDLVQARGKRDAGWHMIRARLLNAAADEQTALRFDPQTGLNIKLPDLVGAYEHGVADADRIADRLRSDSSRAAKLAALKKDLQTATDRQAELAADLTATDQALTDLTHQWQSIWQPMTIGTSRPREMREWLDKQHRLIEAADLLREKEEAVKQIIASIDGFRKQLSGALNELGEAEPEAGAPFPALVAHGHTIVADNRELKRRREMLSSRIGEFEALQEQARREIASNAAELSQWQQLWAESIQPLGLTETALPDEAEAALKVIQQVFHKLDRAKDMHGRIRAIEADSRKFLDTVGRIIRDLAPDLNPEQPQGAVTALNRRLKTALADSARLETLLDQQTQKQADLDKEIARLDESKMQLETMCRQAGTEKYDALPELESLSAAVVATRSRASRLASEISALSGGADLEAFIEEAATIEADRLPEEIKQLSSRIQELEEDLSRWDQSIGEEKAILRTMNGGTDAVEAAEDMYQKIAEMEAAIHRYVRVQLAAQILHKEIEQYRLANQGPILTRAGEVFAELTQGAFARLSPEFDEKDRPILMGVRPSGEKLGVEAMSEGTCDQLYLALRIACIEQRLQTSEPIPLVLDDILVNFDNSRAGSALDMLSKLSRKTQVIFFTHHRHLVDMAAAMTFENQVIVHTLDPALQT